MRASSCGSVRTATRVGTDAQTTGRALRPAARTRRRAATSSGASAMLARVGVERAGLEPRQVEELLELHVERLRRALDAADQRATPVSRVCAASAAT